MTRLGGGTGPKLKKDTIFAVLVKDEMLIPKGPAGPVNGEVIAPFNK